MSLLGDALGVGSSLLSGDPASVAQSLTKGIEDLFNGGQSKQQVNQQLSDLSQALNLASNTIQQIINSNSANNANNANNASTSLGDSVANTLNDAMSQGQQGSSPLDNVLQNASQQELSGPDQQSNTATA